MVVSGAFLFDSNQVRVGVDSKINPREFCLGFFDLVLSVRTDVPEVEEACRALFGRFLVRRGRPRACIEILSDGRGIWRVRDSILDAEIDEASWLPRLVQARLLETAGNEVARYDLYHAAALSRNGHGLVIVGEGGFGKSMLTCALLSRGWRFLSDEVAAVDRGKPFLAPFPKAIELRPAAAEVLGPRFAGSVRPSGKIVHDPEKLFPGCLSPACSLSAVVFLSAPESVRRDGGEGSLDVVVHRRGSGLTEALTRLSGITSATWAGEQRGYPVLSISFDPGSFETWRLDEFLGRHGVLVLDSSAEETPPADFERQPRLQPVPLHEGVAGLLTRFRGRRALAERLRALGGGLGELVLSMLDRLERVRFFRLEVGRLEPTLDLLEQVVP